MQHWCMLNKINRTWKKVYSISMFNYQDFLHLFEIKICCHRIGDYGVIFHKFWEINHRSVFQVSNHIVCVFVTCMKSFKYSKQYNMLEVKKLSTCIYQSSAFMNFCKCFLFYFIFDLWEGNLGFFFYNKMFLKSLDFFHLHHQIFHQML